MLLRTPPNDSILQLGVLFCVVLTNVSYFDGRPGGVIKLFLHLVLLKYTGAWDSKKFFQDSLLHCRVHDHHQWAW